MVPATETASRAKPNVDPVQKLCAAQNEAAQRNKIIIGISARCSLAAEQSMAPNVARAEGMPSQLSAISQTDAGIVATYATVIWARCRTSAAIPNWTREIALVMAAVPALKEAKYKARVAEPAACTSRIVWRWRHRGEAQAQNRAAAPRTWPISASSVAILASKFNMVTCHRAKESFLLHERDKYSFKGEVADSCISRFRPATHWGFFGVRARKSSFEG